MTTMLQPKSLASSYTGVYDAWNRLVEIKDGSTVAEYEYDGLNRRIVRDETGDGGDKVHFYYNMQWQVLEERKEVGGTEDPDPLAQYVYHTSYVDAIVLRDYDANTDGTSVRHYYLQDANYNVVALVEDDGTVIERYQYSPYGTVTVLDADFTADADNKSDIANEYLYTGRRLDPKTGLQLNRNRYYHTELGRFINRDPVGYLGGINLYTYVSGSPLSFVDALGLDKDNADADQDTGAFDEFKDTLKLLEDIEKFKEAIKDTGFKTTFDRVRSGLSGLPQGELNTQINDLTSALKQFNSKSNCGRWYKASISAIGFAAKNCDKKRCGAIVGKLRDKCYQDILVNSVQVAVPHAFKEFSKAIASDCEKMVDDAAHCKKKLIDPCFACCTGDIKGGWFSQDRIEDFTIPCPSKDPKECCRAYAKKKNWRGLWAATKGKCRRDR